MFSVSIEGQHPEVAKAGILDRPKVFFNPATRRFVMHFKLKLCRDGGCHPRHRSAGPVPARRQDLSSRFGQLRLGPESSQKFVADRMAGPYQPLGNPCEGVNPHNGLGSEKTFGGQSTFVMPVPSKQNEWIAMFDIWQPKDPVNAGYLWLPLHFDGDKPVIRWQNEWKPPVVNPANPSQQLPKMPTP